MIRRVLQLIHGNQHSKHPKKAKNRNWETRWMEGDTEDLRLYKAQSGQETEIEQTSKKAIRQIKENVAEELISSEIITSQVAQATF